MKKIKFTEQEKRKVKEAVEKVEQTTSGEIVTFIINKSDNYYETVAWASLFAVMFSLIIINILSFFWLLPVKFNIIHYSLFQVSIAFITFILINYIPALKRLFTSKKKKESAVHKKSMEVFINEEVFNTKERTGILLFISEFEHHVEIIADSGINKKISDKDRKDLVDTIISGIKRKKTADGIVTAIHLYGYLLVKNGYTIKPGDINELKDDIRIEE